MALDNRAAPWSALQANVADILQLYRAGQTSLEAPRPMSGAGEGIRTLDVNLGKVALYH